MDDGNVTQASVSVSDEGMILESSSSLGSCKFKGESYVCQGLSINHPSHHTIEGVQADGEVTAIFRKPTGELMCMSTLFRINSAQTPSYSFFKQFVPYAVTTGVTNVQMRDWSISALVPPEASYYTYHGSTLVPPCVPCEWIVFKAMINMDQGDFAYLVRNAEAGSRPVQALGDREVFFNDTNNVPGGPMPHDNKFYLKLRPTGNTKVSPKLETKAVDLKGNTKQSKEDAEEEANHPTTILGQADKAKNDYISEYGTIGLILGILAVIGVAIGIWKGYSSSTTTPFTFEFMRGWAIWTREKLSWIFKYVLGFLGWVFSYIYGVLVWMYNGTVGAITWAFMFIPNLFRKGESLAKEAIEKAAEKRAAQPQAQSSNAAS
jgi:hypothetical protein